MLCVGELLFFHKVSNIVINVLQLLISRRYEIESTNKIQAPDLVFSGSRSQSLLLSL